nr:hypothetical protein [Halomarina salina]
MANQTSDETASQGFSEHREEAQNHVDRLGDVFDASARNHGPKKSRPCTRSSVNASRWRRSTMRRSSTGTTSRSDRRPNTTG